MADFDQPMNSITACSGLPRSRSTEGQFLRHAELGD
jgi:hypothetical protein